MKNALLAISPLLGALSQGVLITNNDQLIYKNGPFDDLLNTHSLQHGDFIWRVYNELGIDHDNVTDTTGTILIENRRIKVSVLRMNGYVIFLTNHEVCGTEPFAQFPETMMSVGGKFRLPLSLMVSSLRLVAEKLDDDMLDRTGYYLAILNQNFYRLLRLSNNIAAMSRYAVGAEKLKAENVDIVELVKDYLDELKPYAASANILLEFDSAFEYKIVDIDVEKLELALYNLLSNALKYTPAGGRIMVRLSSSADAVFISVIDNGCGITEAMLPHVFTRYATEQKDPSSGDQGFGIGLAIVKAICELHNGNIVLRSKQGEGTTVTMSIPASQGRSSTLRSAGALNVDYAGGFSHILLEFCDVLSPDFYMIK